MIPDEPEEVTTQLKRQEFITSKIIGRTPDEDPTPVSEFEREQRQSLAKFAPVNPRRNCCCCLSLCCRKERPSLHKEMKFNIDEKTQLDARKYPTSARKQSGVGVIHNPMAGV
jgi:hypothetical protein